MINSSFSHGNSPNTTETGNRLTQILGAHVRLQIERKIASSADNDPSLWIPYLDGWNGCYTPKIAKSNLDGISDTELGKKAYKFKGIKLAIVLALLSGGGYEITQLINSDNIHGSKTSIK